MNTPGKESFSSSGNLFTDLPQQADDGEIFEPLYASETVAIERIVSCGHASAPDFWYDQDHDEWVVLLRGKAVIEFADGARARLQAGDWLVLPTGCRHRVSSTDRDALWLAIHASPGHENATQEISHD